MHAMQNPLLRWLAISLLVLPPALMAEESALSGAIETKQAGPVGHFPLPETGNVVGHVQTVKASQEDTLIDIGRRHGVGYEEIRRANPELSVWMPGEGTNVVIPTRFVLPPGPREGIVVNVAEMRLYYYPPVKEDEAPRVETYPVSVGRMDWKTPLGETKITAKAKNPAWYPPDSIIQEHAEQGNKLPRIVPPGPDNPLGQYAMRLDIPGYLIHGTNRPDGVGMRVTHGCIRMLPEDIESLFPRLPLGTQVRLINEPFKLGWSEGGILHVQVYPSLEESEDTPVSRITTAVDAVSDAVKGREYPVDYARLRHVVENPDGLPQPLVLIKEQIAIKQPRETLYDQLELRQAWYNQLDSMPVKEDA